MDEKTLQALTVLADKLGTTDEYLWEVLIRQAIFAGTIDLLLTVIWLIGSIAWFRLVYSRTKKPHITSDNRYPRAEWENEAAFFSWLSVFLIATIGAVIVTVTIGTTLAALFNPEYWALIQILK